jgi:hypothetical protein
MGEWLLSRRNRLIVARHEAPLEFGHLETGFHFVPEGRTIVARRFIAGLAIHRICVPEGRLKLDIDRRSCPEICGPKGQENSAPGFQP